MLSVTILCEAKRQADELEEVSKLGISLSKEAFPPECLLG